MTTQPIPIDLIDPDPKQPRKVFDQKLLAELAASIEESTLLQPITVRPNAERYVIVAGERRWRAHCLLANEGRLDPPVIMAHVRDMAADEVAIVQIVENLQRADVTALEESDAFAGLVAAGMDSEEIARRCGVAKFRVDWRLSLQNLAPDIRALFASGNITQQQANEVARLDNHEDQHRVMGLLVSGKITGWKAVRTAVEATVEARKQIDIFDAASSMAGAPMAAIPDWGDIGPPPDRSKQLIAARAREEDIATLSRMELRIETLAGLAATGWSDGQCIIATKVSRDRARLIADKLAAIKIGISVMERQLRASAAREEVAAMCIIP